MKEPLEQIDMGAILARGESPFPVVETCIRGLAVGDRVELLAPFEPAPLYAHFESWGAVYTVEPTLNGFRVRVEKVKSAPDVPRFLDLRGLPPSDAGSRAVDGARQLAAGACLILHFSARPPGLAEDLETAGIRWEEQALPDGSVQLYLLRGDPDLAGL